MPPVCGAAGTSTLPVSVCVTNVLSVSRLPVTSPVSVFTIISAASEPSNATLPVLRLDLKLFGGDDADERDIPRVRDRHKAATLHISQLGLAGGGIYPDVAAAHVADSDPPVVEESSRPSADMPSTRMPPVLVFIATEPEAEAKSATSPYSSIYLCRRTQSPRAPRRPLRSP